VTDPATHPIRIVVTDDLRRSRLTVFFRLFLAIPHYIWALLLGTAVALAVFANWFIVLFKTRTPDGLHNFVAGYLRYMTHLEAYFLLAANPYPGFYLFDDKPYPVDLVVAPPERQNRWKVFFRLFLAIPALLLSATLLWGGPRSNSYFSGGVAFVAAFFLWWFGLFMARAPRGMRDLVVYCLGYSAQLYGYLFLLTDRYPYTGPSAYVPGGAGTAEPPPPPQWVLEEFRADREFLVLTLITHDAKGDLAGRQAVRVPSAGVDVQRLVVGSPVPEDILGAQASAVAVPEAHPEAEAHPVSMSVTDDFHRSRVLVFFRLPLAIPHILWLILWTIVVFFVVLLAWLSALVVGHVPTPFHRFLARYVRYSTHLFAFIMLVGGPFPGFVGKPGTYPVDLELPATPVPQRRLVTLFRLFLAVPAIILSGGVGGVLWLGAIFGWFVSLIRGRMPDGLANAGAYALRYGGQVNAYLYLLTERYPDSGPRPDPASP
jgi:hypothetical protein